MSRGPGRWQRAILAALGEYDVVPVAALVKAVHGRRPTRSELVSARRAAHVLADAGKVREIYPWFCAGCETVRRTGPICGACRRAATCALAITRDPQVMAPQLIGTSAATSIPERLSVAFIRDADEGNAYGAKPAGAP